MSLVLCSSAELKVSLDPTRVEDQVGSVAFDLVAEASMPYQQARISAQECWFTHEALSNFESQVSELRYGQQGSATLLDMSERPVITLKRSDAALITIISTADTLGMVRSTIEVRGYASELEQLLEQFKSYPRWW